MNTEQSMTPTRQAVINGLAVVGFIALVAAGIWLAIYSTRFVPTVVNRIGSAAVYLGSVFTPADEPTLSVVPSPAASTTISFGGASSTPAAETVKPPAGAQKPATTAGLKTDNAYQIGGFSSTSPLFGTADLTVTISAVGYLATTSAESFVASTTVPSGSRPAVRFTIKNIGTNLTAGAWRFSASIPTQTAFLFLSQPQQALAPGDRIDYTLGFDQANKGSGQTVSVSANFDRAIAESNFNNNGDSANLTILGG